MRGSSQFATLVVSIIGNSHPPCLPQEQDSFPPNISPPFPELRKRFPHNNSESRDHNLSASIYCDSYSIVFIHPTHGAQLPRTHQTPKIHANIRLFPLPR